MSESEEKEPFTAKEADDCLEMASLFATADGSSVRINSKKAADFAADGRFPFLTAGLLSFCGAGAVTVDTLNEEESGEAVQSLISESLGHFGSLPVSFLRGCLTAICTGRRPSEGFFFLEKYGALDRFLPELAQARGVSQNRFHLYDVFDHSVFSLDAVSVPDLSIRLAALFHDLGKTATRRETENGEASFHNHELVSARLAVGILKRFGYPVPFGKKTVFLVRNHMFHYTDEWTDKAVRRFAAKTGTDSLNDLITLRLADRTGSGKKSDLPKAIQKLIRHIEEVQAKEAELKVRDLAVGGSDLMEMGVLPGPQMGQILKTLLELVKSEVIPNEKEPLTIKAKEILAGFSG